MSALGQKQTFATARADVRFTAESRHVQCSSRCPLWAKSRHCSFDHFVGAGKQRRRHREAERLGSPEIDRELEFCRQFYRKVAGLLTIENADDINAGTTIGFRLARSIADQPAGCN